MNKELFKTLSPEEFEKAKKSISKEDIDKALNKYLDLLEEDYPVYHECKFFYPM